MATPPEPPEPTVVTDTLVVTDTVTVQVTTESGADPALQAQVATLQLQLLESEALSNDLQARLDATIQEVVRTMAKLQSQANRAEAASGMAEAELAVETLVALADEGPAPEIDQARELMGMSTNEFNGGNYGGALYLASQARGVARAGERRLSGDGRSVRPGEVLFALPLQLQTTTRSNVRSGPGMAFGVLFTLDRGSVLTAQSYSQQWVRVRDTDGRDGWIFHSLVTSRGR